ncbi:MAG: AAA-like domain-containing protein [Capsulimonadales bacterium]|nr:AAA-like domain-containing protein [Capsulimonadales bacterium]
MNDNTFFVTGGTLPLGASSYVSRQADIDLYTALVQGQYCYLLNTRQMGKSSLVVRTAERLRQEVGASVAIFELSAIGQNITPDQLYYGLTNLLGQQLGLEDELDEFWFSQDLLSPMQRFFEGIRRVALPAVPGPLVIVVDEVDALRTVQQHFSTDEFFGGIRDCHNRRVTQPEFRRLTFCLVGVATPSSLIRDTRVSPFNVGQRIVITDFTEQEASGLAAGLGAGGRSLLPRVLYWTGGHPYLTQRLCQELARQRAVSPADVDRECQRLFLTKTARESDDNLTFVRDRLLRSSDHRVEEILDLYSRLRSGRRFYDDDSNPLYATLRLSGVVKVMDDRGRLSVRNRIYERVFDGDFIRANTPGEELRRQEAAARRGRLQVGALSLTVISTLLLMLQATMTANSQAEADARRAKLAQTSSDTAYRELAAKNGTLKQVNERLAEIKRQMAVAELQALQRVREANRRVEKERANAERQIQNAQERRKRAVDRQRQAEAVAKEKKILADAALDRMRKALIDGKEAADAAAAKTTAAEKERQEAQVAATLARNEALAARTKAQEALEQLEIARNAVDAAKNEREETTRQIAALIEEGKRLQDSRVRQENIYLISSALNELESGSVYTVRPADNNGAPTGNIGRAEQLLKQVRFVGSRPTFEWLYLNSLCHSEATLDSLSVTDGVHALGFVGNTNALIAADPRGALLFRQTGRKRDFGFARFRTVAISPQGDFLAGGDARGNVQLKAINGTEPPVTCSAGLSAVTALAFSRGRQPRLLVGHSAGKVSVWNVRGQSLGRIDPEKNARGVVRALALDENGDYAIVSTEKQTAIYSVSDSRRRVVLDTENEKINAAAFFPGGIQAALVTSDNHLLIYNAINGSLLGREKIDPDIKNPRTIAISARGTRIAIGGATSIVSVLQMKAPDPIRKTGGIRSLVFTPDSQNVAIISEGDGLSLPRPPEIEGFLLTHARVSGTCVAFSPDRNYVVVGCRDGAVEMFDRRQPRRLFALFPAGTPAVTRVAISPDSQKLAVGRANGTVTVRPLAPSTTVRTFQPHKGAISLLAFLPDSLQVVTGARGESVHIADTNGEKRGEIPPEPGRSETASNISPDGRYLAIARGDTIDLIEVATGKRSATCTGHINTVTGLVFSPDSTRLVSGAHDGSVKLWDVATGDQVLSLRGLRYWNDSGHVSTVTFAPNGRAVAVGTETGKAIVLRADEE